MLEYAHIVNACVSAARFSLPCHVFTNYKTAESPTFGSSLFSVGKEGRQGKIWNSRIACLAVASHPLHQEKKRREVGFVPPRTAEWREARFSLRGSTALQGELSGSERGNQPRPIQGSEKERDRMEVREWHYRSGQTGPMTPPPRSPLHFVNFPSTLFLSS